MKNNGKIAIATGAFGFAGANLTEHLLDYGYKVYAIGRKGSAHNERFEESESLRKVLIDMEDYDKICGYIDEDDIRSAGHVTFITKPESLRSNSSLIIPRL